MLDIMHDMNQEAIQQSQPQSQVCCLCSNPISFICSDEAYCDDCGDQIHNDMNQDFARSLDEVTYKRIYG